MQLMLSIYGLFRMTLGIAQLVGLTAGFFIVEWVVRYPKGAMSFVFDQDILAIVYLAVLLRAFFHIVSGIGITRSSGWVTGWLGFGWPVILIIVGGLIHTQMTHWVEIGLAKNIFEVLSWPKLIVYLMWVGIDCFLVIPTIRRLNQSKENTEGAIQLKSIGIIFFAVTAFFVILLFLGKPIKQGFHQGYYRIKEAVPEQILDTTKINEDISEIKKMLKEKEASAPLPADKKEEGKKDFNAAEEEIEKMKPELSAAPNVPDTIAYRQSIGYIGALGVIIGLLLQFISFYHRETKNLIYAYLIQSVGFFLLLFYTMLNKILPVVFLSFFALSLSVTIMIVLWFQRKKFNEDS